MSQATGKGRNETQWPTPAIDGHTKVVGIVADPIGQVRTPQAFNALMAARGINAVVVPLQVAPGGFAAAVKIFAQVRSMAGLVVTIPYKESILPLCDELTDAARQVGAVNIVRFVRGADADADSVRMIGSNLDGEGFAGGLLEQGHALAGREVYLAGAGGAAKAIAHALAGQGVAAIGIHNRNPERAAQLVAELQRYYPQLRAYVAPAVPRDCTLAINSTSLGLAEGDPLPFPVDQLPPGALVAEAVMKVELTPLLAAAQARGLTVHYGRHMMETQIERMAQFLGLL
ncbi:shikimate dehydrogenase family protein [Herbaspirillum sp. NPDC087042]|uniref:shikimate dehydrogenase family protein n=1 Tax=Herbaspirillum sp. NPDC087042 TaxID=3364004 RepID=UPI003804AFDA